LIKVDPRLDRLYRELLPEMKGSYVRYRLPEPWQIVDGIGIHKFNVESLLLDSMGRKLAKELKNAPYEKFKAEFFRRAKQFSVFGLENVYRAINAYNYLPEQRFGQSMKAVKEIMAFIPRWEKQPDIKLGSFTVKHEWGKHPEAPICLAIYKTSRNWFVGSAGFTMYYKGGRKVMRITNVQGARGDAEELAELSTQLGENWRINFTKRLIEWGKQNKLAIEGQLPRLFEFATEKQYRRYKRQTKQTFRKAGLKPQKGDVWRLRRRLR
jgi:hypothetical protein